MFSGLIRYTVILTVALTGLLMFCVPLSRADDGYPVLSMYMSNTGVQLTFGMSNSPEPLVEISENTWDNTEVFGHPPSLSYNDSPIVFFRRVLNAASPAIKREMSRLKLFNSGSKPMQVYVAAAGADAAERLGLPNSDAYRHLRGDQQTICMNPGMSRKEFFSCFAQQEVLRTIYQSRDMSRVRAKVEQDASLIAAMATQHAKSLGKEAPGQPSLVIHTTTISHPYLVRDGKAIGVSGWIPASMRKSGGIYEIGYNYSTLAPSQRMSLTPVIALDPRSSNHPNGQAGNIARLQRGKGFNNFGRLVGETANSLNRARIEVSLQTPVDDELYRKAIAEALPVVNKARENFIALTTAFYALTEHEFTGKAPHIIIVGEESDILFPTAESFISKGSAIAANSESLAELVYPIISGKQQRFETASKTQAWISENSGKLFSDVETVSTSEFSRFQHQGAVKRLPIPFQSPAAP
ncbi:hypothetical protein [Parendozoicomonas sp. Alg238-R29]|uniref:hypothetical protein n=1 Tax=Parendozoicomonas sp. Alg238-R29 TaxID=2993446 RepID=UPI00248E1F6D|nr:hypothetical protein [Parendozoicomonas sp. Alg238-R29]